jgi:predicted nucleic acid-binding protein
MPADLFIDTIYSEDLSDEQDYGGIRIINPFKV